MNSARDAPGPVAARLLIATAAILWSTGGAAIKLADLNAMQISGGRAIFAGLTLYLVTKSARGRWTAEVLKTAVAYATTMICFVAANRLTTAANAIFIQNIAPVWVLLLGPFLLGEKHTKAELWSVPVSLLGCVLFFAQDLAFGRIGGNLAAAGASVSYALLIMQYRKLSSGEGLTATVAGNALVVVVCSPWLFMIDVAELGALDVGALVYLGSLQQAASALLFVRGIRAVSALEGSLLILLEPLFAPVWAFLAVGERLGPWAILGAGLILISTVWRSIAVLRALRSPGGP